MIGSEFLKRYARKSYIVSYIGLVAFLPGEQGQCDELFDVLSFPPLQSENWNTEIFTDAFFFDSVQNDGNRSPFSRYGVVRYSVRIGYAVGDMEGLLPVDLSFNDVTFYLKAEGAHSFDRPHNFLNVVNPGIGVWVRPLRAWLDQTPEQRFFADLRVFGEFIPEFTYYRNSADNFSLDGSGFQFGLDWYGEYRFIEESWVKVAANQDLFANQVMPGEGPSKVIRWSNRPGLAIDIANKSRLRLYIPIKGAYGYDDRQAFNNNYEVGFGVAVHPFYGLEGEETYHEFLRQLRFYYETIDVTYFERTNPAAVGVTSGQPDRYQRFGVELWMGRY